MHCALDESVTGASDDTVKVGSMQSDIDALYTIMLNTIIYLNGILLDNSSSNFMAYVLWSPHNNIMPAYLNILGGMVCQFHTDQTMVEIFHCQSTDFHTSLHPKVYLYHTNDHN